VHPEGRPHPTPPYSACGDGIYNVNLECLHTYCAYFPPAAMTQYMNVYDADVKACHQTVEWGYRKTAKIFRICTNPENFRLQNMTPVSGFIVCFRWNNVT
jgi:hypothetical protein